MTNTLGYYNPYFYAQEALIQLEKALGMAARVHLGYDEERRAFRKGEYVNIRRPSSFVATDVNPATGGTTADVATESVQVQLSNWKEVKFALTDKELAFTSERIIDEHIRPAAYALADNIDAALNALYFYIPWQHNVGSGTAVAAADITTIWQKMFDAKCPMNDLERMHFEVGGKASKDLLDATAFTSWSVAGSQAEQNLLRGNLGQRYGFNFFSNQNVTTHTKGTLSSPSNKVKTGWTKGDTSVTIYDTTLTGTLKAGDTFTVAGDSQAYAVTADATAASNEITVSISPALAKDAAGDAAVTHQLYTGVTSLAFHRNALALVTAPLSEIGDGLGARIAAVQDPKTGLALRSRIWYEGNQSTVKVGLDVLYGVKCLDPNLAARITDTA